MTIQSLLTVQLNHTNRIYLLPQGAFFHAYNEGAVMLSSMTGYKLRAGNVSAGTLYTFCGFPISALDSVLVRIAKRRAPTPIGIEYEDTMTVIVMG